MTTLNTPTSLFSQVGRTPPPSFFAGFTGSSVNPIPQPDLSTRQRTAFAPVFGGSRGTPQLIGQGGTQRLIGPGGTRGSRLSQLEEIISEQNVIRGPVIPRDERISRSRNTTVRVTPRSITRSVTRTVEVDAPRRFKFKR